jgi:tetratricopeptide (TPR) repeat protein
MARATTLGVVLALTAALGVRPARAQPVSVNDPQIQQALQSYLQDPEHNRRSVLRIAARGLDNLPLPMLAVLADAELRNGRSGAASQMFQAIIDQYPDSSSAGWAEMGLGWAALAHGDFDTARDHYQRGADTGGDKTLAGIMLGLIDASSGDPASAVRRLDELAKDPSTPAQYKDAIQLYDGYARYWAGDTTGADDAFSRVAASTSSPTAADDARYAGALTRARLGDTEGAAALLGDMSTASSTRRASPERLVDLDARTLMRAAFRRYRHHGKDDSPSDFLHGDGRALAHASARRRRQHAMRVADGTDDGGLVARAGGTAGRDGAATAPGGAGSRAGDQTRPAAPGATPGGRADAAGGAGASRPRWRTFGIVALLVLLGGVVLRRRMA